MSKKREYNRSLMEKVRRAEASLSWPSRFHLLSTRKKNPMTRRAFCEKYGISETSLSRLLSPAYSCVVSDRVFRLIESGLKNERA